MKNQESVLTKERIAELEAELDHLKIVRRKEIADKIKTARSFGDLSENSEYDEAKNEQAMLESRINQLEKMLTNVKVLDVDDITTDRVGLHSIVKVRDMELKTISTYTIVNSSETDVSNGYISNESPLGSALIGKSAGQTVDVVVPSGAVIKYKLIDIGKPENA